MSEISLIIITGTIIFLVTAGIVTFFFYLYKQRLNSHLQEKEKLKIDFQNELLKAQLEMQEQTFLAISQEIHDNIGQILSLAKITISTINAQETATIDTKVNTGKNLLDQAIDDLRSLSKRLNAQYVSHLSLYQALELQLGYIQATGKYQTALHLHGAEKPIDAGKKLIIFRMTQEILNNSLKHAQPHKLTVTLDYRPDKVILSLHDDGTGFNPQENHHGIGIQNLYYRANLIGAQLILESQLGGGTLVQLTLPL